MRGGGTLQRCSLSTARRSGTHSPPPLPATPKRRRRRTTNNKQAMPPDGALVACDRDERSMAVARRYWREAGVDHKVTGWLMGAAFRCCLC